MRRAIRLILAIFLLAFAWPNAANAAKFDWRWKNRSGHTVHVELYSQKRNVVWPGKGRVWIVPPNRRAYSNRISCRRGEQICFGAWIAKNSEVYWGVGKGGVSSCRNCCWRCDGKRSRVILFDLTANARKLLGSSSSPAGTSPFERIREDWVAEGGSARVIIGSLSVDLAATKGKIVFGNGKVLPLTRSDASSDTWTVNPPQDPILKRGTRLCGMDGGVSKLQITRSGKMDRRLRVWSGGELCADYPLYEKTAYEKLSQN